MALHMLQSQVRAPPMNPLSGDDKMRVYLISDFHFISNFDIRIWAERAFRSGALHKMPDYQLSHSRGVPLS